MWASTENISTDGAIPIRATTNVARHNVLFIKIAEMHPCQSPPTSTIRRSVVAFVIGGTQGTAVWYHSPSQIIKKKDHQIIERKNWVLLEGKLPVDRSHSFTMAHLLIFPDNEVRPWIFDMWDIITQEKKQMIMEGTHRSARRHCTLSRSMCFQHCTHPCTRSRILFPGLFEEFNRTLIVSLITVLHAEVKELDVKVDIGENQLKCGNKEH